jgi:hypothetical protein
MSTQLPLTPLMVPPTVNPDNCTCVTYAIHIVNTIAIVTETWTIRDR